MCSAYIYPHAIYKKTSRCAALSHRRVGMTINRFDLLWMIVVDDLVLTWHQGIRNMYILLYRLLQIPAQTDKNKVIVSLLH